MKNKLLSIVSTPLALWRGAGGEAFFLLCLALLALASCSKDEQETTPVADNPKYSVQGQWWAEVPLEGETQDMLAPDEMAPYDHVVVVLSMFEDTFNSTLLYLYGDELIGGNYGIYLAGEEKYTIDKAGNITAQNIPEYTGEFKSARYANGEIKVKLVVREGELNLTFHRPTAEQLQKMAEWMALIYSGMGYIDDDEEQQTGVVDDPAVGPVQVKKKI